MDGARVLTQEHTLVVDGKEITTKHPVAYVSGLFCGSQLNWAAITKEAYAIYMTVKSLLFTLQVKMLHREVIICLSTSSFKQMTLNNTVNNWGHGKSKALNKVCSYCRKR